MLCSQSLIYSTINITNKSLFKIFVWYSSIFNSICNSFLSHIWIIKIISSTWFFKLKFFNINKSWKKKGIFSTLVIPTPITKTRLTTLFILKSLQIGQRTHTQKNNLFYTIIYLCKLLDKWWLIEYFSLVKTICY